MIAIIERGWILCFAYVPLFTTRAPIIRTAHKHQPDANANIMIGSVHGKRCANRVLCQFLIYKSTSILAIRELRLRVLLFTDTVY